MTVKTVETDYSDVHVYSRDHRQTELVLNWMKELGHEVKLKVYAMVMVDRVSDEEEFDCMMLGSYDDAEFDAVVHISFRPTMPGTLMIDGETHSV